jgi:hypothetical protein
MATDHNPTTDPRYLRTFAVAEREAGNEEAAFIIERAAYEIERLTGVIAEWRASDIRDRLAGKRQP